MSNEQQQPKYQLIDAADFWFANLNERQQQFILDRQIEVTDAHTKIRDAFLHMNTIRSHPDWPADELRKV